MQPLGNTCATEWSGGKIINLGGLPSSTASSATAINDSGQVVGFSAIGDHLLATEWSRGRVIDLGGLSGSTLSLANSINNAGLAVGYSVVGGVGYATEWSGGQVVNLGGLPGPRLVKRLASTMPDWRWVSAKIGAKVPISPLSGVLDQSLTLEAY